MESAIQPNGNPPGVPYARGRGDHEPPGAASLLVGRQHDLAVLRARLSRAMEGHGGVVLVSGEAGIGKTALAAALARQARAQGVLVLAGQGYDLGGTPPYGPWAELFDRAPADAGLPAHPALGRASATGTPASQAALIGGVRDWLRTAAACRPLLLLLDDLHWADPASLDLLRLVARQASATSLLLVGLYRPDDVEPAGPFHALLPVLVHEAAAGRLALRPLTDDDLGALVRARYTLRDWDEARLVAYLHERSGGNPFFAGELLRALEEEGVLRRGVGGWALGPLAGVRVPSLLRQIIDRRVAQLGVVARELLAVAAVLGQEVPLTRWRTVSGAPEEDLVEVAERALAAHILAEAPGGRGVHFAHALVREALYEGLALPRRQRWHRRAGEVLAGDARDPADQRPQDRAETFVVGSGSQGAQCPPGCPYADQGGDRWPSPTRSPSSGTTTTRCPRAWPPPGTTAR